MLPDPRVRDIIHAALTHQRLASIPQGPEWCEHPECGRKRQGYSRYCAGHAGRLRRTGRLGSGTLRMRRNHE